MASRAEQSVSSSLRGTLVDLPNGESIPNSEQFREVLCGLEYYVPEVLSEIHPEWRHESLDGIIPLVARKTSERQAEIFGLCIIISDQTLTPLHIRLRIAPDLDEVSWLECRLAERGKKGMLRMPYQSDAMSKRLYALEGRADLIDWVYKVTFGDPRL